MRTFHDLRQKERIGIERGRKRRIMRGRKRDREKIHTRKARAPSEVRVPDTTNVAINTEICTYA